MASGSSKKCTGCNRTLLYEKFSKGSGRGGRNSKCKDCDHEYYMKNRSGTIERAKARMEYAENRYRYRELQLIRDFGLTLADYNRMLAEQGGNCKICGIPESRIASKKGTIAGLSVDHDHMTGEVRGLLCAKCNSLLGFANDRVEILENAANYLKEYTVG